MNIAKVQLDVEKNGVSGRGNSVTRTTVTRPSQHRDNHPGMICRCSPKATARDWPERPLSGFI
eukprot:3336846-Rhodomonas_salina.2